MVRLKERRIFFLVSATLLLSSLAILSQPWGTSMATQGSIRYVAVTGTDGSDCSQASHPCRTVQYAVDAAHEGDVIKVAAGRYTDLHSRPAPPAYPGSAIVTQIIYITKAVSIEGGYTIEDWITPDPDGHPTILDAQGLGRVILVAGDPSTGDIAIEGLQLVAGNAAQLGGDPAGLDAGGDIYAIEVSLTLRHSRIVSGTAATGGGLYSSHTDWTLHDNVFEANVATGRGGGLCLSQGRAYLTANVVRSNVAAAGGGGLLVTGGEARLANNVIVDNQSDHEAPGLHIEGAAIWARHTTVAHNLMPAGNPYTEGSGIYVDAGAAGDPSTALFTNTLVATHTVGANIQYSTARFRDTLWYGNRSRMWVYADVTYVNDHYGHPAFVDTVAGDYHLLPGSAALDIGIDAGVHVDLDGDTRPQWCGYDIGADELVLGATCYRRYLPLIWHEYLTFRPVTGSVLIEDGRCCAGGYEGDTITLTVEYTATSPFAPVAQMRRNRLSAAGCMNEQEMNELAWQAFVPEEEHPVYVVINWVGYSVSVQYRDTAGYVSPIYCDDIAVEGHPRPPTSVPTPVTPAAPVPPPIKTPRPPGSGE